jgi:glycosyltransferase involved in cell wall biosynthesis
MSKINNITVSVVMPVYNAEAFIEDAVKGVLHQTHENFEFLIINDHSTDATVEIIERLHDSRVKIIKNTKKGSISAYNCGFRNAQYEFVFITDHDDICKETRIEKQLAFMIEHDIDVCGSYYNITDEKRIVLRKMVVPVEHNDIVKDLLFRSYIFHNPTVCIRKRVFDNYGYFDESYTAYGDIEYYLRICKYVHFGNVPDFLYNWRTSNKSLSHKIKTAANKTHRLIGLKYLEKERMTLHRGEYYFKKGLLNYYTDYLLNADINFVYSFLWGNISHKVIRYLMFGTLLFLPLKLLRRYNLFDNKNIQFIKYRFDHLLGD